MNFLDPYLSKVERANLLQQWILVHSVLYYERDNSVVKDSEFDSNSKQLVGLMKTMSEEERQRTKFFDAFRDFVGFTGYDLYSKLNHYEREFINLQADNVLKMLKRKRKRK